MELFKYGVGVARLAHMDKFAIYHAPEETVNEMGLQSLKQK